MDIGRRRLRQPVGREKRREPAEGAPRADSRGALAGELRLRDGEQRGAGLRDPGFRPRAARRPPDRRHVPARHEDARALRRERRRDDGRDRAEVRRKRPCDSRRRARHPVHGPRRDRQHGVPVRAARPRHRRQGQPRVRPRGVADAADAAPRRIQVLGRAPEPHLGDGRAHRPPLLPGFPVGRHQARPARVARRHASRGARDPLRLRRGGGHSRLDRLRDCHDAGGRLDEHDAELHALVPPRRARMVSLHRRRGVGARARRIPEGDSRARAGERPRRIRRVWRRSRVQCVPRLAHAAQQARRVRRHARTSRAHARRRGGADGRGGRGAACREVPGGGRAGARGKARPRRREVRRRAARARRPQGRAGDVPRRHREGRPRGGLDLLRLLHARGDERGGGEPARTGHRARLLGRDARHGRDELLGGFQPVVDQQCHAPRRDAGSRPEGHPRRFR